MRLEEDPTHPDRWIVRDHHHHPVGSITRTGPDEWRNVSTGKGDALSPVPLGPFATRDLAFDAFTETLLKNTTG